MAFFKKRSFLFCVILCFIGSAFIILDCFSFKIVYHLLYEYKDDISMDSFFKCRGMNFMYLIDSEFVVMIIFFMLTALFINGNNITLIFLNHQSWYTFSKTLFISMLMVSSIVYFNLYQSSSRIKFNLFNITFVTLYILILLYFFSSLRIVLLTS